MSQTPACILVFSGKRKSGKDFLADELLRVLGQDICCVLRLSAPLKKQYAKIQVGNWVEPPTFRRLAGRLPHMKNLDPDQAQIHSSEELKLMEASSYKEIHRAKMIKWGEDKRNSDPGYFCDIVVQEADPSKKVWIISDARRKTDIQYFRDQYPHVSKFIRISASDDIKKTRGFEFTPGVDDAESECGLDDGIEWDFLVENNNNCETIEKAVLNIVTCVQSFIHNS